MRGCASFKHAEQRPLCNASCRRLASVQVHYGETIKLVGSPAELGSWNVGAAPELTWSDGDIWTAKFDLAPGDVHFKVRHHAHGEVPCHVLNFSQGVVR